MQAKAPQQSKTVWLNSVILVLSVIFAVANGAGLIDEVPPEYTPWITGATAIINVVLRFISSAPVKFGA